MFWINYFTSSKLVENIRNKHGDPDIIQIRKTFNSAKDARLWEIKVISRMNIVKDKRFLNQRNPGGLDGFIKKAGSIPWNKGLIGVQSSPFKNVKNRYSTKELELISKRTKQAMNSDNIRQRYEEGLKSRDNCNNRFWINKNGKHKRIKRYMLNFYLNDGWLKGRLIKNDPKTGKFIRRKNNE